MDDIIVWGRTMEEHDERLMKTLAKLHQVGIVINLDLSVPTDRRNSCT